MELRLTGNSGDSPLRELPDAVWGLVGELANLHTLVLRSCRELKTLPHGAALAGAARVPHAGGAARRDRGAHAPGGAGSGLLLHAEGAAGGAWGADAPGEAGSVGLLRADGAAGRDRGTHAPGDAEPVLLLRADGAAGRDQGAHAPGSGMLLRADGAACGARGTHAPAEALLVLVVLIHFLRFLLLLRALRPRAERPAAHLDADGAVVRGARRWAAAHHRVGEAALARALVAEQHHLDEVARRSPATQVAQEGQHRDGARAHHARRRRVQVQESRADSAGGAHPRRGGALRVPRVAWALYVNRGALPARRAQRRARG